MYTDVYIIYELSHAMQPTSKCELSCLLVFLIIGGKPLTSREFSYWWNARKLYVRSLWNNATRLQQIPPKENVFYAVAVKTDDLQEEFTPIVEELIMKKKEAPRISIFCSTYNDCHSVYLFKYLLKEKLYYPSGVLKVSIKYVSTNFVHSTAKECAESPHVPSRV